MTAAGDSLTLCRFVGERGLGESYAEKAARLVADVTGWDYSAQELQRTGARIYTLERLVNVGLGLRPERDTLPFRVSHEPVPGGPSRGAYCPEDQLRRLLERYYAQRGWSAGGVPGRKECEALGLGVEWRRLAAGRGD